MKNDKKPRTLFDALAVALFTVGIVGAGANLLAGCAGWGAKTCSVVDLAKDACGVVRFMGEDGTVQEMKVTPEDMREAAKAQARRQASRDGGPDADASSK
jgi:hypothetical protein